MTTRTVHHLIKSMPASDGAGVKLRRSLGQSPHARLDPFLMLDEFSSEDAADYIAGFPAHPHRGFETVTFIVDGELTHRDSGGHESVIRAGGVQWMTAGSGLVHAELSPPEFMERGGPLEILQLWVNLPSRLKMTAPRYVGLQREDIPSVSTFDRLGRVNVIAGEWGGATGPVDSLIGHFMSTVELKPGGRVVFPAVGKRQVFLYVVRGRIAVGDVEAEQFQLVELSPQGDAVEIVARTGAVLLFGHAEPIGEPVVSYGPFVMNTEVEIRKAIADYQAGRFGSVPG
jgi:redox-sensitive bicupin YhaK (pirin superfamily)